MSSKIKSTSPLLQPLMLKQTWTMEDIYLWLLPKLMQSTLYPNLLQSLRHCIQARTRYRNPLILKLPLPFPSFQSNSVHLTQKPKGCVPPPRTQNACSLIRAEPDSGGQLGNHVHQQPETQDLPGWEGTAERAGKGCCCETRLNADNWLDFNAYWNCIFEGRKVESDWGREGNRGEDWRVDGREKS